MCTIFIAYKMHPKYPLIYLGNRDEFKSRPTEKSQWYDDVLMGKDLDHGGTWMGINKTGKLCCLTNYRDMSMNSEFETSRGTLVSDYLIENYSVEQYSELLINRSFLYKGFNIIFGTVNQLYFYSNVSKQMLKLEPGIYGLSNASLDTPWHKINLGKQLLTDLLYDEILDVEGLFDILNSTTKEAIENLPETGLSIEIEHQLSSIHVDMDLYGTVFKQVIFISTEGEVSYFERTIDDYFKSTVTQQFFIV